MASHPSQVITTRAWEGGLHAHRTKQKWLHETHSVTYAPGLSTLPHFHALSCSLNHHSSVVQWYLHTILPAQPQFTSYTPSTYFHHQRLLAIQFSSILSTCPNHLNTLWSALLVLSIPVLLHTSLFVTVSICDTPTKCLKHFISRTFTVFLSALLIPHTVHTSALYNAIGTITPSYRHFFTFIFHII